MNAYQTIVFIDGDEADTVINDLYNCDGVVAHGMSNESIRNAVAYLMQWEYHDTPDEFNTTPEPPFGAYDDTIDSGYECLNGGYILSANLPMNYVSLTRKVIL